MRPNSQTKYAKSIFAYTFIFTLSLLNFSCKKSFTDDKSLGVNDLSGTNVSEHTKNYIGVKEDILVRLSTLPDLLTPQVGEELSKGIASISPSASGKFIWKDQYTIAFIPNAKLESNTTYTVQIQMEKLFANMSNKNEKIELSVHTYQQDLTLSYDGIEYDNFSNGQEIHLNGKIQSLDEAENKEIESTLKISQKENNDLAIMWNHINGKNHLFTITKIKRFADKNSEVLLEYDGTNIDSDFKGSHTLPVVKKDVFAFMEILQPSGEAGNIEILFSDVIDPTQDLKGLITIDNFEKPLSYDISANKIIVYLDDLDGEEATINIHKGIKNTDGKTLVDDIKQSFNFPPPLPQLKALSTGVIMPETKNIYFPFEAKNIKRVAINITKIYQNNVLQFLQFNNFNDHYDLRPVGKSVYKDTVDLSKIAPLPASNKWQKYTLDLSKMIKVDKGAIYNVMISFDKDCLIAFPCETSKTDEDGDGEYDDDYYGYEEGAYKNPCKRQYYYDKEINTNVLASDIGTVVKGSKSNEWKVACASITNAQPLSGANIEFYDFQKQVLAQTSTDGKGIAAMKLKEVPSFAIIKKDGEYAYLKLETNFANTTSEFDVNGKNIETGIDAFIYGERGVYRPGDTMHISVMLFNHDADQGNNLPSDFPLRLNVKDSKGKVQYEKILKSNQDHIYYFAVPTKISAPTGNWRINAIAGNEEFTKNVKVETVKPNRLKISYTADDKELYLANKPRMSFESKWLHGASAAGLKAEADVTWSNMDFEPKTKKDYKFSDPARTLDYVPSRVFEGNLDANGKASYVIKTEANFLPPSALSGVVKTRVFEKSGNFSDDYYPFKAFSYSSYVGVKVPESQWGGHYLTSNTNISIPVVAVDPKGNPLSNKKLTVGLYDAEWNWWYNEDNSNILKYNTTEHIGAIKTFEVKTDGKGEAKFTQKFDDYKNYMIRICDPESGHCTGDFFYTSPWGNPPSNNSGPQLITLKSDKEEYKVGENIKLRIPSNSKSRILISIEKGNQIDQLFWIDAKEKETIVDVPVTKAFAPNVYLHVTLVQPYSSNAKGLPVRMYGILPIKIADPSRIITPIITAANIIEPGTSTPISIKEKNGEEMYYTLAVVDEGLLDLTRFKTPDPLDHFFSKQALNVNTWDIYDFVMNKYGDQIENIFSVGGDADGTKLNTVKNQNRFLPIVRYFGPYKLAKGGSKTHQVKIDNYVGSVKLMVVAKSGNKFGNAEKVCPVKKDLMVQNTVPRIVAPGDEFVVGANVFAMNDKVKNVAVKLLADSYFTSVGNTNNNLSFDRQGDKLINFPAKAKNILGIGKIGSSVNSNNLNATEDIHLEIRNPNPKRTESQEVVIEAGKSADLSANVFGIAGSNSAEVELSTSPIYNMSSRLKYLIQYPYGCIEQTTSSAFPQLSLKDVLQLSPVKKNEVSNNVSKAIQRISLFQTNNGGFAYWPGNSYADDWGSNYAGHFLVEAKAKGYYVPESLLQKWAIYQAKTANNYREGVDYQNHTQAYRLYTLAKYGKPELGSMNRLKNAQNLDITSIHTLASAYALVGKIDVAKDILKKVKGELIYDKGRDYEYYTYGSDLRNQAMYLESYQLTNVNNKAATMVKAIVKSLKSSEWYNTQAVSYALMTLQKYFFGSSQSGIVADIVCNSKSVSNANTTKTSLIQELPITQTGNQRIKITNKSKGKIYVRLNYSGQDPLDKVLPSQAKNIAISVSYVDGKGTPVHINNLSQGTNFTALITTRVNDVAYSRIENLALNFIVPAGWEINNERMAGISKEETKVEYQDYRDDRVISFFDLQAGNAVTVAIPLTATYQGAFYMPPISCEAMYYDDIYAQTASSRVVVSGSKKEVQ